MAFPTVVQTSTSTSADSTTHSITLPGGLTTGNLLVIVFATDGDNTVTNWDTHTGFFNQSNGTTVSLSLGYRRITGGEGGSISITTSVAEPGAHTVYEITGAEDPATQAPEAGGTTGSSATPDPPNFTPTGGAKDYMWIATVGADRRAVDGNPTNCPDSQITAISGGAGGCSAGMASDGLNLSSFNPDTFSIDNTDTWVAATVAIHPPSPAVDLTFDTDAILKATTDNQFVSDALLKATFDNIFDTDAILKATTDNQFVTDAILKATFDNQFVTDAILKATFDNQFVCDAILTSAAGIDITFDTDALLKATTDNQFVTDALLKATFDTTFDVDARLANVVSINFTTDAILIPTYASFGMPFLFTAANWGSVALHLEVFFRATSGKAYARLFDETTSAEVVGSEITTTSATLTRFRSGDVFANLVDGNVYRVQFGATAADAGAFIGGKLIVV